MAEVVFSNLNSLIQKEFGLLSGMKKEMKKLANTFRKIEPFLEDAEMKRLDDTNKAIKDWLQKLDDTAYDLDNILDECETKASRLMFQTQNSGLVKKVRTSFSTRCNVKFRYKICKRMKKIRERLDVIAENMNNFYLSEGVVVERGVEVDAAVMETGRSSILTQPPQVVYGREEDKERIVEFLVNSREGLSIYPITGMAGLGKTTLAELVSNDERVIDNFDQWSVIWVSVSGDFDVKRVIKAILLRCGHHSPYSDLETTLLSELHDALMGKKYLLVLDDVWWNNNEDQEKWEKLKSVLACGYKGSSVLTTTRSETVANVMGTVPLHHLSGLSEDYCWSLFRQRAFGNEAEESPNLVEIGRQIVRKCPGVPFAAMALGSLMRFKRVEREWRSILESEIWEFPQNERSVLPALKLSYYHLPMEWRRCFSFCALFPEDFQMEKEYIIDLWMANGLFSSDGQLDLEDKGNYIWDQLYLRSFFQDASKSDSGQICFQMHHLVRDLAKSVVEDECFCVLEDEESMNISKRTRNVSFFNSYPYYTFPKDLYKAESLRTLFPHKPRTTYFARRFMPEFFSNDSKFAFLRVLNVSGDEITSLPSSIGELKHLRYLDLSSTEITMLPASICSLWNLQTLDLRYCRDLESLPKHMSRLRNLRHLYLHNCDKVTEMPPKIGQLTCLNMLCFFIVGKGSGFRLTELQYLKLRGRLEIRNLHRVTDSRDAIAVNLVGKRNLRKLELCWKKIKDEYSEMQEQILEALEPHPNLEELSIQGYKGFHFPSWLENLTSLYSLSIFECHNLASLPAIIQNLPQLQCLTIRRCPQLEMRCKRERGEDWCKISHIPVVRLLPSRARGEAESESE